MLTILNADMFPLETTRNVVYSITCKHSWKTYVGKTERTFYDRYPGGKWWLYTTNRFLKADHKRYGENDFFVEIITTVDNSRDLIKLESYYIGYFMSMYPFGYNLSWDLTPLEYEDGVTGVWYAGIVGKRCGMSEPDELISKNELSTHIASTWSSDKRERIKNSLSRAHSGKIITQAQREAVSKAHKGIPLSAEHVSKIKQAVTKSVGIPVKRYTLNGEFIDEYPSINEAGRQLKLDRRAIGNAINGKSQSCGGYKWKHETN